MNGRAWLVVVALCLILWASMAVALVSGVQLGIKAAGSGVQDVRDFCATVVDDQLYVVSCQRLSAGASFGEFVATVVSP